MKRRQEIIKGLELCTKGNPDGSDCVGCPYFHDFDEICSETLKADALRELKRDQRADKGRRSET